MICIYIENAFIFQFVFHHFFQLLNLNYFLKPYIHRTVISQEYKV